MSDQAIYCYWENPTSQRYYQVYLACDLLGEWVLSKAWGSKHNARGAGSRVLCSSHERGISLLNQVHLLRQRRGYVRINRLKSPFNLNIRLEENSGR